MIDGLWNCQKVIDYLGINLNNLRQIQHRGSIKWVKKIGKEVYYSEADVVAYKIKRDERNQK
jgi:predicted site-specific integrase-resolvase